MIVRTGSLAFPRARGGGPRTDRTFFNFTNPVSQAVAGLTGTTFGFSARDDHHLGLANIRLSTTIDDDVVTVEGTFGVRDWSGEFDDDYEGTIQFVLLAELETGTLPSNLSITGVEYNQTIQFFRSQLDPATARPDNAIELIGGKNTILRIFADTQTDPTRPTIAMVSGALEIRLPGGANWIPIAPLNGPIAPRQDSAINRRNANDTLNFIIPGPFCTGNVEYRVRVFDSAHADQNGYTSGRVQGTLRFNAVEPLLVRGVGVHYTGLDSAGSPTDIAAPDIAALRNTLSFVLKNYPVGQLIITGFDVIDYTGDFTATSDGGCGSGWSGLLSRLREMQGDDTDVYYGLVPSGVPTSGTIGCGGGDGRVGSGFVGDGPTAAQEIGHSFGRDHAPCGNPGNPDPNYPIYDALPMGSIGEVGIDDLGNVQDPSTTSDFMSYCGPSWVSPYTYEGLLLNFPPVPSSARALKLSRMQFSQGPPERRRVPNEYLFLNFRIYRGGKVEVFPSFHYKSRPLIKSGRWTPYAVELRDRFDSVLVAERILLTDPHSDLDSASLDFFKPIPFDKNATRIVFTCGKSGDCEQEELFSMDVPTDPPKVRITQPDKSRQRSGKVKVAWEGQHCEKQLYYLLRYSNDGGETFRALAPRLTKTEYLVDLDRLPGGEKCLFQVLATDGVRTAAAVSNPFSVPQRPRETMIATPPSGSVYAPGDTVSLVGESFSPQTGSAYPSELEWHSDLDGPLGKGQEIHVQNLRPGVHRISLTANDGCEGKATATIQIEVKSPPSRKHTSLSHPDHTSKDHDTGKVPSKPEQTTGGTKEDKKPSNSEGGC